MLPDLVLGVFKNYYPVLLFSWIVVSIIFYKKKKKLTVFEWFYYVMNVSIFSFIILYGYFYCLLRFLSQLLFMNIENIWKTYVVKLDIFEIGIGMNIKNIPEIYPRPIFLNYVYIVFIILLPIIAFFRNKISITKKDWEFIFKSIFVILVITETAFIISAINTLISSYRKLLFYSQLKSIALLLFFIIVYTIVIFCLVRKTNKSPKIFKYLIPNKILNKGKIIWITILLVFILTFFLFPHLHYKKEAIEGYFAYQRKNYVLVKKPTRIINLGIFGWTPIKYDDIILKTKQWEKDYPQLCLNISTNNILQCNKNIGSGKLNWFGFTNLTVDKKTKNLVLKYNLNEIKRNNITEIILIGLKRIEFKKESYKYKTIKLEDNIVSLNITNNLDKELKFIDYWFESFSKLNSRWGSCKINWIKGNETLQNGEVHLVHWFNDIFDGEVKSDQLPGFHAKFLEKSIAIEVREMIIARKSKVNLLINVSC